MVIISLFLTSTTVYNLALEVVNTLILIIFDSPGPGP
jgi:hypothetical protein